MTYDYRDLGKSEGVPVSREVELGSVRDSLELLFRYDRFSDVPIGGGGFGQIWKAHDRLFDLPVAIKTINEASAWRMGTSAKRSFVKEAQAGARLGRRSRNIVKVFDLGMAEDIPYFTMEWIEPRSGHHGIDISQDMGRCTLVRAKSIIFDVLDALVVAHENKVVHSDIAPWNIVYDPSEQIFKLSDFGLLKIMQGAIISQGSGSLLVGGRADFFPRDVRSGVEEISYASDVYALAVTLRTLVEGAGCLTENGGAMLPTPGAIRVRHEGGRDAPPQLTNLLLRFIDSHTSKDTVQEFRDMLQRVPS
ncbi:serine/threonine protein kinase [Nonomuraea sp. NN258]|uniref:serine/threonine-protein kinase n=1 Tax=Nonomuraea antri TaxID=2730852 RepID=UPI00156A4EDA|nr:serine/threonine-protein kinase [Nonomuraea antri]NRQ37117.1 serine/threonine protein kinase [Nonomuraea antri]